MSSTTSAGVAGSSVASSMHLQFQRSCGWCFSQNGCSIGKVSFFSQYERCEASASGDVVGIQRRLGNMSLFSMNSCQSAAACARSTAVLYSVRSHAPVWCEAIVRTSLAHCSNGLILPFASRSLSAIALPIACTLNAANTSLPWRMASRKRSLCRGWYSPRARPSAAASFMVRCSSCHIFGSISFDVSKPS